MNEATILLAIKLILQNQNKLAELFLLALQGEKVNKNQIQQALETMLAQNNEIIIGLDRILISPSTKTFDGRQQTQTAQSAQAMQDMLNMLGRPGL